MTSTSTKQRFRKGFTILELLVSITIIGILVALILPAVQQARESARRISCANNMKQLGVAVQHYHDVYGSFPPGGVQLGRWFEAPVGTTWTISLLPFLDQTTLFFRYKSNLPNTAPENELVRRTHLSVMTCPSDINGGASGIPESGPGSTLEYATGSYHAVSGRSDGRDEWWDQQNNLPRKWRGAIHHVGNRGDGTESMHDVADGTSNTIIVGEYSSFACPTRQFGLESDLCRRTTFWAYAYTSYNQSTVCPECGSRTIQPDFEACVQEEGLGGINACKRGWGSFHTEGLNFLKCDGSVFFISNQIDMFILGDAATIDGGEIARAPF